MIYLPVALRRTFANEGIYSNYADDPGGETILGVSRRWNPHLDLWSSVDLWDKIGDPPAELLELVTNFYRGKIWEPFQLEKIADIAPEIAYAVFDTTVHLWVDQSIPFLQLAINKAGAAKYPPIDVDGWIGNQTLSALERLRFQAPLLGKIYGIIRGSWYLDDSRWDGKSPGFINRIDFSSER